MTYEIESEREHPCPCGESTYVVVIESNDWGSDRESWRMNCGDCRDAYVRESFTRREGDRQYVGYRWAPVSAG
jgi:hypothetical protein